MLWPFFLQNIYIFSIIFKPIVSNESILNNSMSLSLKDLFINFKKGLFTLLFIFNWKKQDVFYVLVSKNLHV